MCDAVVFRVEWIGLAPEELVEAKGAADIFRRSADR